MCIGLGVKNASYSCKILMELEFSLPMFEKYAGYQIS
jgi:hypothetical protein